MNILFILATPGSIVGGMEKQVALQAKYLSQIPSTQVSVIAASCYQFLFSELVQFIPLDMSKSRRNPKLLFALLKSVHQSQADIIHAHGHKAAALLSSIRHFIGQPNGHPCILVATSHGIKRNNKALKKMDQIFTVSEGVQEAIKPLPAIVIHNGIETCTEPKMDKTELCHSLELDATIPLILGVGRLVKLKHFERLVIAAKDLKANLVILGDGPERENLQALAGDNVVIAGFREDVRSLLYAADLMVICSDREGFSLALIEALQSRLPILSTPVAGSKELLPPTCLIDSTEPSQLAQFIQGQLDNLSTLNKSLESAFDFVTNELKIERVAERTLSLYDEMLEAQAHA